MVHLQDIRIGNIVQDQIGRYLIVNEIKIEEAMCTWSEGCDYFKYNDLHPALLTEQNILKLRRLVRADVSYAEFRSQPPGERQIDNQYWSSDMHDGDQKMHLCPSYGASKDENGRFTIKNKTPDFWFSWIQKMNGSSYFVSATGLRQLKYIHQLQNLFHILEGSELWCDLSKLEQCDIDERSVATDAQ